jgi:hypothetical protein
LRYDDFRRVEDLTVLLRSRFNVVGVNELDSDSICTTRVLSSYGIVFTVVLYGEPIFLGAAIRVNALSLEFVAIGSRFVDSRFTLVPRPWVKF